MTKRSLSVAGRKRRGNARIPQETIVPFLSLCSGLTRILLLLQKWCLSLHSLPQVNTVPLCIISVSGLANVDTKDTLQQCSIAVVLIVTDDTDYANGEKV